MKTNPLQILPRGAKIAATKELKNLGLSERMIARTLGIGARSVSRYSSLENDIEWQGFGDTIKKIWLEQDFELSQLAIKRIKETVSEAKLYQAIGLLKTVREFNQPQNGQIGVNIGGNQVAVQIVRGTQIPAEGAQKNH